MAWQDTTEPRGSAPVVLTQTPRQRWVFALFAGGTLFSVSLLTFIAAWKWDTVIASLWFATQLTATSPVVAACLAQRVELWPDGIVVVRGLGPWNRTALAWSEVESVEVRTRCRWRRVVLRTRHGRIPTPAPADGWGWMHDRDFDARAASVNSWWQATARPDRSSAAPEAREP